MQAGRGLLHELFALVWMAHLHSNNQIMDENGRPFYRLQIEQAARGCISGILAEWPQLAEALRQQGHPMPPETPARELKTISREILSREHQGEHP